MCAGYSIFGGERRHSVADSKDNQPFLFGVAYWPRRKAFGWWRNFDRGEVRDELAQIAGLGFSCVRFCLRWEDVQPGPERLHADVLRAYERALDLAADAGLRVMTVLFPVALGGALHVPRWANQPDPLGELQQIMRFGPPLIAQASTQPVIYDQRYHHNETPDLFRDTRIRAAQTYLVQEVVGYFGAHPAQWAWQLGEGLECARKPDASEAVREWYAAMAEEVRAAGAARVVGVTSVRGLTMASGPRPEHLAEACDLVGLSAAPPLRLGRRRFTGEAVVFLHALASALAGRPIAVTGLGLPTTTPEQAGWIEDTAFGQPLATFLADEEQQATYVVETLERLYNAGAPGIWLAAYADYPSALWQHPPLNRAQRERTLGLIASDGREKQLAQAIARFADRLRAADALVVHQPPTLDLDPERYWREPRREYTRLWREWSAETEEG